MAIKKRKKPPAPKHVSMKELFRNLQCELEQSLKTAGLSVPHSGTLGDVTESDWIAMLRRHLPARYSVDKAFVVDSKGRLSQQIDVVIYDKQYSLVVFHKHGAMYVPAESVYAVFEVKQTMNAEYLKYAMEKAASVRRLKRTSVPIMSAVGTKPSAALAPKPILAGLLSYRVSWKTGFGTKFQQLIASPSEEARLDIGCSLRSGAFNIEYPEGVPTVTTSSSDDALVSFFMTLLHRLQPLGTVTAIDLTAYGDFTLGKRHGT